MLNCFINKLGISQTLSPSMIVMGRRLDFKKHCTSKEISLEFGCYVEANEDPGVANTNRLRTYPAIYLGPAKKLQGTKKVFDLLMGTVKKPRSVTSFPMPDRVIELVDA